MLNPCLQLTLHLVLHHFAFQASCVPAVSNPGTRFGIGMTLCQGI